MGCVSVFCNNSYAAVSPAGPAPMIMAVFLDIILKKKIEKLNNPINNLEVVLYATMQEEENQQDTYYIAKVIKELLIKDFPNLKDKIKIEKVSRNPSDYGVMIEYYAEKLNKFNNNYDRIYVGITGGTQAQNNALIINSVLKWEEKVRTIYKPRGKEPKENKIGEKIFKILGMKVKADGSWDFSNVKLWKH